MSKESQVNFESLSITVLSTAFIPIFALSFAIMIQRWFVVAHPKISKKIADKLYKCEVAISRRLYAHQNNINGSETTLITSKHFISLRKQVSQTMFTSSFGRRWEFVQILLTFFSIGQYVFETYVDEPSYIEAPDQASSQSIALFTIECIWSILFTIDYILHFWSAPDRLRYIWSFFPLIDYLSILPFYAQMVLKNRLQIRFLQVLRVIRSIRSYRLLSLSNSAIQRQTFLVLLTLGTLVFVNSALIQLWESTIVGAQELSLHESVYMTIITVTTVGYGDYTPVTNVGKTIMVIVILATVILLPVPSSRLIALLSKYSGHRGRYRSSADSEHVVLCTLSDNSALPAFISEFFHPDSARFHTKLIILSNKEPEDRLLEFISNPLFGGNIKYYQGSALEEEDLDRTSIQTASAAFLLAPKFYHDSLAEDAKQILVTLAILDLAPHLSSKLYIQVIRSSTTHHIVDAGVPMKNILVFEACRYNLLSYSVLVPGLNTLLSNLFKSYRPADFETGNDSTVSQTLRAISNNSSIGSPSKSSMDSMKTPTTFHTSQGRQSSSSTRLPVSNSPRTVSWLPHYIHGLLHEPFQLKHFPDDLIGSNFHEATSVILETTNCLLIGLITRRDLHEYLSEFEPSYLGQNEGKPSTTIYSSDWEDRLFADIVDEDDSPVCIDSCSCEDLDDCIHQNTANSEKTLGTSKMILLNPDPSYIIQAFDHPLVLAFDDVSSSRVTTLSSSEISQSLTCIDNKVHPTCISISHATACQNVRSRRNTLTKTGEIHRSSTLLGRMKNTSAAFFRAINPTVSPATIDNQVVYANRDEESILSPTGIPLFGTDVALQDLPSTSQEMPESSDLTNDLPTTPLIPLKLDEPETKPKITSENVRTNDLVLDTSPTSSSSSSSEKDGFTKSSNSQNDTGDLEDDCLAPSVDTPLDSNNKLTIETNQKNPSSHTNSHPEKNSKWAFNPSKKSSKPARVDQISLSVPNSHNRSRSHSLDSNGLSTLPPSAIDSFDFREQASVFSRHSQTNLTQLEQTYHPHLEHAQIPISSVFETDLSALHGHIIICAPSGLGHPSALHHLLKPLHNWRTRFAPTLQSSTVKKTLTPIVFLVTSTPSKRSWNVISQFMPNIYFIIGSSLRSRDLLLAGALHAHRILILAPPLNPTIDRDHIQASKAITDGNVLFSIRALERFFSSPQNTNLFYVGEILFISNFRFISGVSRGNDSSTFDEQFIGVQIKNSSNRHSTSSHIPIKSNLVCPPPTNNNRKSLNSTGLSSVHGKFIKSSSHNSKFSVLSRLRYRLHIHRDISDNSKPILPVVHTCFAGGHFGTDVWLETLLCQSFTTNPWAIPLARKFAVSWEEGSSTPTSHLSPIRKKYLSSRFWTFPLPSIFLETGYDTFGSLFYSLSICFGVLPIAIYRHRLNIEKRYVITNPPRHMTIVETDHVICLSVVDPQVLLKDIL